MARPLTLGELTRKQRLTAGLPSIRREWHTIEYNNETFEVLLSHGQIVNNKKAWRRWVDAGRPQRSAV